MVLRGRASVSSSSQAYRSALPVPPTCCASPLSARATTRICEFFPPPCGEGGAKRRVGGSARQCANNHFAEAAPRLSGQPQFFLNGRDRQDRLCLAGICPAGGNDDRM